MLKLSFKIGLRYFFRERLAKHYGVSIEELDMAKVEEDYLRLRASGKLRCLEDPYNINPGLRHISEKERKEMIMEGEEFMAKLAREY